MQRASQKSSPHFDSPVIFIVDDDHLVLNSLAAFFDLETTYSVTTFHSPSAALSALEQHGADLIISDFMMEDLNGLALLGEAKKLCPNAPRILLTGYADKENAIKAINEVGLYQYVEKPWDNDHLLLVVQNALDHKSLQSRLEMKIGELDALLHEYDATLHHNKLLQTEFALAKKVQQSFLPEDLPRKGRCSFQIVYEPAFEVGGDFYDVIRLQDDWVAVFMADITGHGVQAALSTVLLKHICSLFEAKEITAGEFMKRMNRHLYQSLPQGVFVAGVVAMVNTATGECRIMNAGAPHPVWVSHARLTNQKVPVSGLLLGVVPDESYQPGDEITLNFDAQDILFLFTDGLFEIEGQNGAQFGRHELAKTIDERMRAEKEVSAGTLVHHAKAFANANDLKDDLTVLTITFS